MDEQVSVELVLHGVLSVWSSAGARSVHTVPGGSTVGDVLVQAGLPTSTRWAIIVDGRPADQQTRLVGPDPIVVAVFPRISGGA